jgi:hypothetical protein
MRITSSIKSIRCVNVSLNHTSSTALTISSFFILLFFLFNFLLHSVKSDGMCSNICSVQVLLC